jgi:SAM-dependent methyltransferase
MDLASAKRHSPAAERNCAPIAAVLRAVLPAAGTVLEVASGSGQHAAFLAKTFPALRWQPTDLDLEARASIEAWVAEADIDNVAPPLALDASAPAWPVAQAAAVVCLNMIHIAPWAACTGLIAGAARILADGAPLYLYGPYLRDGHETAPSNRAFDASLRARDPSWGLRRLEDVSALAARHGFGLDRVVEMPANNLSVVYRREVRL